MNYYFEWDLEKATKNYLKHKTSFELAATIFFDPKTITLYNSDHSETEDRWITMGISRNGSILTIVHTYQEIDDSNIRIRIISARKSTKNEINQYQGK